MKKIILSTISCIMLVMASCSSDDDGIKPVNISDVAGKYEATNATVKVSGVGYDMTADQAIVISGTDSKKMSIEIPAGMVPGEENAIKFDNVVVTSTNICVFEGSTSNNDRTLNIKGSYANKSIAVEITPEYKSNIIGAWNFAKPNIVNEEDASQVIYADVKTPTGIISFLGNDIPDAAFGQFLNVLLGQGILRTFDDEGNFTGAIQNVTFHKDGNLTADYNLKFMQGDPQFVASPMGGMRWYVKNNKVFLVPNLNLMARGGIASTGIPMEFVISNNVISVYFTIDQIAPVMALVGPIVNGLPDEIFGDNAFLGAILKMAVTDITNMTQVATTFSLGVTFVKDAPAAQ